jgi:hypothetical protein
VKPSASLYSSLPIAQGPRSRAGKRSPSRVTAKPGQAGYATLANVLGGDTLRVYVERTTLNPEDCTDDYRWSLK